MASTRCRAAGEKGHARLGARGQSSLEYALVLLAFVAMVVALCTLWRAAHHGLLLEQARRHASHSLEGGISSEAVQDVLAY